MLLEKRLVLEGVGLGKQEQLDGGDYTSTGVAHELIFVISTLFYRLVDRH